MIHDLKLTEAQKKLFIKICPEWGDLIVNDRIDEEGIKYDTGPYYGLNIGQLNYCIVGEAHGLSSDYDVTFNSLNHSDPMKACAVCTWLGQQFFRASDYTFEDVDFVIEEGKKIYSYRYLVPKFLKHFENTHMSKEIKV